jgi:hypothetical protein
LSPDGTVAKPRVAHPWSGAIFSISPLVYVLLYAFLPDYVPPAFCPSGTFISGHMGSQVGLLGILLVFPSWFILVFCVGARSRNMKGSVIRSRLYNVIEKHCVGFMITAFCGLLVSLIGWVGYAASYYCATPNTILLHPDVLNPAHVLSWNDVEVVRARCWAGSRSPWQGGFSLSFIDGEEILLRLGTRAAARNAYYDRIRASLAGKVYQYDASGIGKCPRDVYPLFANWRN